jgi:hypothetical protein
MHIIETPIYIYVYIYFFWIPDPRGALVCVCGGVFSVFGAQARLYTQHQKRGMVIRNIQRYADPGPPSIGCPSLYNTKRDFPSGSGPSRPQGSINIVLTPVNIEGALMSKTLLPASSDQRSVTC